MLVPAATSATCDATTVTVQVVLAGRLAVGVSVKAVAPPAGGGGGLMVNASGVPVGHCTVKADEVTVTASLKLIAIVVVVAWLVAAFVGVVEVTVGATSVVKPKT